MNLSLIDNKKSCGTRFALGRQVVIDFYDCSTDILLDSNKVKQVFNKSVKLSGAVIIGSHFHNLKTQGVSGVTIIAESHFTIHTWPEYNYAAVDIFTCCSNINVKKAIKSLKNAFHAGSVVVSPDICRGTIKNLCIEKKIDQKDINFQPGPMLLQKEFDKANLWGMLYSIDIYRCDSQIIGDTEKIKRFAAKLCNFLDVKSSGDCQIVTLGKNEQIAGYGMTQFIEKSHISGHFACATNVVYLDIFSCKYYEPRSVAEFAVSFFKGKHYMIQLALRK